MYTYRDIIYVFITNRIQSEYKTTVTSINRNPEKNRLLSIHKNNPIEQTHSYITDTLLFRLVIHIHAHTERDIYTFITYTTTTTINSTTLKLRNLLSFNIIDPFIS